MQAFWIRGSVEVSDFILPTNMTSVEWCVRALWQVMQAERDLEHFRGELRRAIIARKRTEERRHNSSNRTALLGVETGGNGTT